MYRKCAVIGNRELCPGYMRLVLEADEMTVNAKPGQFVMLKCWEGNDPFLMRPFSINSIDKSTGRLAILYKLVGRGTALMARLQKGDEVRLLGPLGHGFPVPPAAKRIALVGRGIGAAPMRYLAESAMANGIETHLYLSASREEYLFDQTLLEAQGAIVKTCADPDRLVTQHFEQDLKGMAFDAAYTCGSKRLMQDVRRLQKQHGFAAFVSLEEHMACGIGACKGCICSTRDEAGEEQYSHVCKDGPVFALERVVE